MGSFSSVQWHGCGKTLQPGIVALAMPLTQRIGERVRILGSVYTMKPPSKRPTKTLITIATKR
jgi:hypothetical protein